ncbi:MAG TPA: hypothetical protein VMB25_05940 [Bryobacteraceae bacterium]|nr:hypothetical protein [Bryobacteraceae bacterium]
MTNRLLKVVCLLASLGAFTATVNAESSLARVHIPFEFAAGGKMLPPGDYTLESPDMSSVLVIRGTSQSAALLGVSGARATQTTKAQLIFERKNGELFLSGVEVPGRTFQLTAPFLNASQLTAHVAAPEMAGTK